VVTCQQQSLADGIVLLPLAVSQVSRLQREVEGLEEQRARAREDAKRSELARQQLEQEIKVNTIRAHSTLHCSSVISCA
jgi:DNA-binding transcriptional regulator YdaS (Cro superfamily)